MTSQQPDAWAQVKNLHDSVYDILAQEAVFVHSRDGSLAHAPMPEAFGRLVWDVVVAALVSLGATAAYDVLRSVLARKAPSESTLEDVAEALRDVSPSTQLLESRKKALRDDERLFRQRVKLLLEERGWPRRRAEAKAAEVSEMVFSGVPPAGAPSASVEEERTQQEAKKSGTNGRNRRTSTMD